MHKDLKKYLKKTWQGGFKKYFSLGSLYLSMIEMCRDMRKHVVTHSEYCTTMNDV